MFRAFTPFSNALQKYRLFSKYAIPLAEKMKEDARSIQQASAEVHYLYIE
jgi:hypothetical protein